MSVTTKGHRTMVIGGSSNPKKELTEEPLAKELKKVNKLAKFIGIIRTYWLSFKTLPST